MSTGRERTVLTGGRVVTPEGTIDGGAVAIEDGVFDAVGRRIHGATNIDVSGKFLLPGFVDLHGDDIERHLFPRAEDSVPPSRAIQICDQAAIAAGVTTKCHALAFENTPDENRSLELADQVADGIAAFNSSGRALSTHLVHLRCELTSKASVERVCARLDDDAVALASLVTHVPGEGQFDSPAEYADRFDDGESVSQEAMSELVAQRTSVPDRTVRARALRLLARAGNGDVPVAAHDCEDPATVERHAQAGVDICEFPVSLSAAQTASAAGMCAAMGAPNLVRGESIWDNLSARRAIDDGVVDVLCSDFRPQSLLASVFVDTGESLTTRVARVTSAPADAIGLTDRGRIEPGARGDLIVVDPGPEPRVERVFVAGKQVYDATPRPFEDGS
ncbi:alpha-D-ribose 1-methylphosphonate 5-triphosphate diphosphatase [Halobacteriales archaeon QS_4_62_28]|nr:MAG: alpha-D-ribose 1-methylphosphonate 5-triphosphate diphosphatase [Halobacteriales archaeon QS_4_62_28]